jgi:hypothetical protein
MALLKKEYVFFKGGIVSFSNLLAHKTPKQKSFRRIGK